MADIGTNSTIGFGSSAFAGQITSVSHSGLERAVVQTSHLTSTTWHSFIGGDLVNAGELEVNWLVDPISLATTSNKPGQNFPPITKLTTEAITFTLNSTAVTKATIVGQGIVTSASYDVPLEDVMTGSFTIKFTGSLAFTDAA